MLVLDFWNLSGSLDPCCKAGRFAYILAQALGQNEVDPLSKMSAIAIPDLLGRFISTTLTFEELATLDAQELGSENSPYAVIGLTISNALVKAAANLSSSSRGVALLKTLAFTLTILHLAES